MRYPKGKCQIEAGSVDCFENCSCCCCAIAKNANSNVIFQMKQSPKYIWHRNQSLAIGLWLGWIKTPRKKWLRLGVLSQRHSNSVKIQSIWLRHVKRAKTSKQKRGKESSKALRYLQKWKFYYKTDYILALVTKRHWMTSFIRKYSRKKT